MGIGFRCCCGDGGGSLPPGPSQCSSFHLSSYDLVTEDFSWQVGLPTGYTYQTNSFGVINPQGRIMAYNANHLGMCAVGVTAPSTIHTSGSLLVYDFSGTLINGGSMIWGFSSSGSVSCSNYLIDVAFFCMDESSNLYGGGPDRVGRALGGTRWGLTTGGLTASYGYVITYGANFDSDGNDYTTTNDVFETAGLRMQDVYGDYPESISPSTYFEAWQESDVTHIFIDESTDRLYCIVRGVTFRVTDSNADLTAFVLSFICELNKETGTPLWVFVPAFQWPSLSSSSGDDFVFATAVNGTLYCDAFNSKRFTLSSSGSLIDEYDENCGTTFDAYACRGRVRHKGGNSYYKSYCDEEGNENSSMSSYDVADQCVLLPRYDMGSFLTPSIVNRWYSSTAPSMAISVEDINGYRFDSDGSDVFFLFPACVGADSLPTYRLERYDSDGDLIKIYDLECPQIDLAQVSSSFTSEETSYFEGQAGKIFFAGAVA